MVKMAHRDLGDLYRSTGGHLTTYIFKADAVLDSAASAAASSSNNGGDLVMATTAASAAKKKVTLGSRSSAERDTYQSKLDLASTLLYLGQENYEKVAQCFLKLGLAKDLGDWVGKVRLSDWVMIIL